MSTKDNQQLSEQLSALADGEANELELRRVLKSLEGDDAMRERWRAYQISSAVLRGESHTGKRDISAAVSAAIADERAPIRALPFLKPLGQFAIAASVAAIALIGVQQTSLLAPQTAVPIEELAAASTPASTYQSVTIPEGFELPPLRAQTVSASQLVQVTPVASTPNSEQGNEFDREILDRYILEVLSTHNQASAAETGTLYPLMRTLPVAEAP